MQTHHRIILADSQQMSELPDCSIQLMVTSPPYPMIKMWDTLFAAVNPQIATLQQQLKANDSEKIIAKIYDAMHETLAKTWREAYRVLINGGIACINIGDATRTVNSRFRLFPNHSRIIEHCEKIGFTTLPYILWKKPTTRPKYKGKGAFLGSGFLPPNAYVTLDCEFILIFRKGKLRKFPPNDKWRYESAFTKRQRNEWFTQIWNIIGTRQTISQHERRIAAYPDEITYRLIRMFSVKGDTVLDPFLGSGTTVKLAMQNERNSVGYEKDETLLPLIKKKIVSQSTACSLKIIKRENYLSANENA
jgi:DNA modification methylase